LNGIEKQKQIAPIYETINVDIDESINWELTSDSDDETDIDIKFKISYGSDDT
jgi:hypothetical protein